MTYRIIFKYQARQDVIKVVDYIEHELFMPIAAGRFARGIFARIDELKSTAHVFGISTYKDILKYDPAARHVNYKGFVIIYSIHSNFVIVHRIIHGSLIKC